MDVSYDLGERFVSQHREWVVLGEDRLCAGGRTVDEPLEFATLAEALCRDGVLQHQPKAPPPPLEYRGLFLNRSARIVPGVYVYPAVMHPALRDRFRNAACRVQDVSGLCVTLQHPDGSTFTATATALGEVLSQPETFHTVARQEALSPGMVVAYRSREIAILRICACRYRHCIGQVLNTGAICGFFGSEVSVLGTDIVFLLGSDVPVAYSPMSTVARTFLPPCF